MYKNNQTEFYTSIQDKQKTQQSSVEYRTGLYIIIENLPRVDDKEKLNDLNNQFIELTENLEKPMYENPNNKISN